jgi:integrase
MFAFAIALNHWAALRTSELLRIRWSDLLFYIKSTAVVVRRAKNHSSPKISFVSHSSGVDNLMSLASQVKPKDISVQGTEKVFSFSRNTYNKAIKAACKSIGIPEGTSHSFRAGFITDASCNGIPDTMIALHARHKSIASLQSYKIPSISDLQATTSLVQRYGNA